ncbi:MAG: hypothetical protein ACRETW_02915, partial [Stenotrophobium sp.]
MLSILRKIKWLYCRDLFFYSDLPETSMGEDVQFFIQASKCFPHAEPFFTTVIDLQLDADVILKAIKKGFSYEIRRAADKDLISAGIIDKPTTQDVEDFSSFYDLFAGSKGLAQANRPKLKELAKKAALVLSVASSGQDEGEWLSGHAYICDGQRARLLYSASNAALVTKGDRQLVGRANKYLHWHMILHFKRYSYLQYDFGGISKRAELRYIDEFKESFGGQELLEYN